MILIWRQSFLQNTCTDILKVWRCEWIYRSQNLNKTLLLLVTARLLARLNNTNGWSPVTLLDTTSLSTQSQLDGWLAGWQLPWSPSGCWCLWEPSPSAAWAKCCIHVMCYCLRQGWAWRYHVSIGELTYHVLSMVLEASGPCPGLFAGLLWLRIFMTSESCLDRITLPVGCSCHRSLEFRDLGLHCPLQKQNWKFNSLINTVVTFFI